MDTLQHQHLTCKPWLPMFGWISKFSHPDGAIVVGRKCWQNHHGVLMEKLCQPVTTVCFTVERTSGTYNPIKLNTPKLTLCSCCHPCVKYWYDSSRCRGQFVDPVRFSRYHANSINAVITPHWGLMQKVCFWMKRPAPGGVKNARKRIVLSHSCVLLATLIHRTHNTDTNTW